MEKYHAPTLSEMFVSGLFAGFMGYIAAITFDSPKTWVYLARFLALGLPPLLVTLFFNVFQIISLPFLPLSGAFDRFTMWWSSWVCGLVWWLLQTTLEKKDKCLVTFSGDDIPEGESAFCVANHVSMTDFFLVNAVAIRKKMLPNVKYLLKDSLKWLPAFGWGMYMCGHVFIKRNWTADSHKILAAFQRLRRLDIPLWLISYVEGTRITEEKHKASNDFAKSRGLTPLDNLLLPRTTGFVSTVQAMRDSQMKAVYDFTFAYQKTTKGMTMFGEAPSLVRIHWKPIDEEYRIHIHVKRYPMSSLPTDDKELQEWLYKRWEEKDKLMTRLRESWTDGMELLDMDWKPVWDYNIWWNKTKSE